MHNYREKTKNLELYMRLTLMQVIFYCFFS